MELADLKRRIKASQFQQFKPKSLFRVEDPITGRIVLVSPNRETRHAEIHREDVGTTSKREDCYYCSGKTPSTLFYVDNNNKLKLMEETRSKETALASLKGKDKSKVSTYYKMLENMPSHTFPKERWAARTFLNLVPSLTDDPELSLVISISPADHYRHMHQLPKRVVSAIVVSWQAIEKLASSNRLVAVPFINGGKRAGAGQSVSCFHSQVYITKTPLLYKQIARRRRKHGCGVCRILKTRSLTVYTNREFKVMAHPAPVRNHSLLIAPRQCVPQLETIDPDAFADALKVSLRAIKSLTGVVPGYNVAVRCGKSIGHIHAEFVPKTETNTPAGFEEATGLTLVTEPPLKVSKLLRKLLS